MALHFLHIGKTGGTAIRHALRAAGPPQTPFGKVKPHRHRFKLRDVGDDEYAFFATRDPVSRFVSSFYSRLRQGRPHYDVEWTEPERQAFGRFTTPRALADALAGEGQDRARAEDAMRGIRHINRPHTWWLGDADHLRERRDRIVFIARQESLSADWEDLKRVLRLDPSLSLPTDPVTAHRGPEEEDRTLSPAGEEAVRAWYAADYAVLAVCEEIRASLATSP